jgi:hypothetical protein
MELRAICGYAAKTNMRLFQGHWLDRRKSHALSILLSLHIAAAQIKLAGVKKAGHRFPAPFVTNPQSPCFRFVPGNSGHGCNNSPK